MVQKPQIGLSYRVITPTHSKHQTSYLWQNKDKLTKTKDTKIASSDFLAHLEIRPDHHYFGAVRACRAASALWRRMHCHAKRRHTQTRWLCVVVICCFILLLSYCSVCALFFFLFYYFFFFLFCLSPWPFIPHHQNFFFRELQLSKFFPRLTRSDVF